MAPNMITISAMAFLMLLPLSSSVSTAGEALNLELDYFLTNEQSTQRTKSYTDVIIGHEGQQREREHKYGLIKYTLNELIHNKIFNSPNQLFIGRVIPSLVPQMPSRCGWTMTSWTNRKKILIRSAPNSQVMR